MFRECKECHETKPIEQFYKHPLGVDGYMSGCIVCRKKYGKANAAVQAEAIKAEMVRLKTDKTCSVCHHSFPPYVLQFKRLTPGIKISSIGSFKQLYREIQNCAIMCANCLSVNAYSIESRPNSTATIWLSEYKENHPCGDCNQFYHYRAMGFHHIDPATKEYNISKARTIDRIMAEIDKCVLLCLNCHMEREWGLNGLSKQRFEIHNE